MSSKGLKILGIIFILMILNSVLYTLLGDFYITILFIGLLIMAILGIAGIFGFKLNKKDEDQ